MNEAAQQRAARAKKAMAARRAAKAGGNSRQAKSTC